MSEKQEQKNEDIREFGQVALNNNRENNRISLLTIIGEIEGHDCLPATTKTTKYEHIMPALVAVEQDRSIEGLVIILNTVGGDVEAGLAIAELIAGMKTPTVSIVVGGGHSIGVPLAVSAKRSFIVPQDRISNFVCRNSGISAQRFKELMMNTGELTMDMGTVIDGETAVNEGLIDRLGGLSDAIEELYRLIETGEPRYPDEGS